MKTVSLQEYRIGANGQYTYDKVQAAIKRFQMFEPIALQLNPNGYYVCDSGGKDSTVIKELARMSGVKFEIHHNHTTIDHPETVYFVRRERNRWEKLGITYKIHYPKESFWHLMRRKKMPPTRLVRYCCKELKEYGGNGWLCVTGVRWSESTSRKNNRGLAEAQGKSKKDPAGLILLNDNENSRKEFETCQAKGKRVLNPIIDWSDDDVWEFIHKYNCLYNPLYDQGYRRVGCVGCPMSSRSKDELNSMPKYKAAYLRVFQHLLDDRKSQGKPTTYESAQEWYSWWVGDTPAKKGNEQMSIYD